MEQQTLFKIRDLRKKDQYKIDDRYLNGYARIFGPTTTAVYNSLSRHAEFHTQEAFPSEGLIAEEHGIGIKSVQRSIKRLVGANIIKVERVKRRGKWLNNNYFLIDKSEWKQPEDIKTLWRTKRHYDRKPEDIKTQSSGHYDPIKDTHSKDTHSKDSNAVSVAVIDKKLIDKLIDCFKDISPTNYSKWFGNTTQRKSAENLLKLYPYEKLENLIINFLPKINVLSYSPKDTKAFSPYELEKNFDKIKAKVFELSKKVAEKKLTTII